MKITQVHYQKLVSTGNYENERIGAWATVEEDEAPADALEGLTAWVEDKAAKRRGQEDELRLAERRVSELAREAQRYTAEIGEMRETWTKARAFLTAVGLELPRSYVRDSNDDDEMPF